MIENEVVRLGSENFEFSSLKEKRVGLVTNHSSIDSDWEWLPEKMKRLGVNLRRVFSPEHGLYGAAKEGEEVESYFDQRLDTEVVSLFGKRREFESSDFDGIDTMFFDIQDVGSRFYTYISTLKTLVDACLTYGTELVVLDRPNPINGLTIRGPMLQNELKSFVGCDSIPMQYGMTIGELATYWSRGKDFIKVKRMTGWSRSQYLDETGLPSILPSPNLPSMNSLLLYPGMCLFEGTNVSLGRGTTLPFQVLGAPWIDSQELQRSLRNQEGIRTRKLSFIPHYSKHAGEICEGIEIHIIDRQTADPVLTALNAMKSILKTGKMRWEGNGKHLWIEYLTGISHADREIEAREPADLVENWNRGAMSFRETSSRYLLYS